MTKTQESDLRDRNTTTGTVVVISGPSGAGKSTIARGLVRRLDDAYLSVSMTTRPKAHGEVDGRDYDFVSREEFQRRVKSGLLLEYAEVFGNYYGTAKDKVEQALAQGKKVILEIDVQGGMQAKRVFPRASMVFILPPGQEVLRQRLSGRGRDDAATVQRRLDRANAEIETGRKYYEYFVVNDDLDAATDAVLRIIQGV